MEEVRDPIFAKALVIESNGCKFCILSLDVLLVSEAWATPFRREAAQRFGLEADAIMICATQTHSAPALGHHMVESDSDHGLPDNLRWLLGGDDVYHQFAHERILDAIERAQENLQAVTVGAASGIEARVAFNRRFVMRDGSGLTHPPTGDPHIRYAEGPIDPEVGIVSFRNASGTIIAALLHHTCHPTFGYPHRYISADWPGAWCDGMRELLGSDCVPLVINGCCGNIAPHNHLDVHAVHGIDIMGKILTETSATILPRIEYKEIETIDWRTLHLPIPWRQFAPEIFTEARALLAKHPEPMWTDEAHTTVDWAWVYALSQAGLERRMQREAHFNYPIQVFRIGEIALVSVAGEPFVEGQLQIKLDSPTYPTYVAHMSNVYIGYIPTPAAMTHGGYETNASNGSKLPPEALQSIVEATGKLLLESFQLSATP